MHGRKPASVLGGRLPACCREAASQVDGCLLAAARRAVPVQAAPQGRPPHLRRHSLGLPAAGAQLGWGRRGVPGLARPCSHCSFGAAICPPFSPSPPLRPPPPSICAGGAGPAAPARLRHHPPRRQARQHPDWAGRCAEDRRPWRGRPAAHGQQQAAGALAQAGGGQCACGGGWGSGVGGIRACLAAGARGRAWRLGGAATAPAPRSCLGMASWLAGSDSTLRAWP